MNKFKKSKYIKYINKKDKQMHKAIAISLTHILYRNGLIENYHANGYLNQEQIKNLNKDIYNRIYSMLILFFEFINHDDEDVEKLFFKNLEWNVLGDNWDEPEILSEIITNPKVYQKLKTIYKGD